MFSNLSKGSILHGIDKRNGEFKWFTGSIERVMPSVFTQFPIVDLDIAVNINGEQREFKGIHSNDCIADFGDGTFVLADNKDSLYNYIKTELKKSEDIINPENIKRHEARIPKYREVLSEIIPGSTNSSEVKELKEQVGNLQAQLAEALSLLKQKGNKKD